MLIPSQRQIRIPRHHSHGWIHLILFFNCLISVIAKSTFEQQQQPLRAPCRPAHWCSLLIRGTWHHRINVMNQPVGVRSNLIGAGHEQQTNAHESNLALCNRFCIRIEWSQSRAACPVSFQDSLVRGISQRREMYDCSLSRYRNLSQYYYITWRCRVQMNGGVMR